MEGVYAENLLTVLLSWDYWELEKGAAVGRGPIDKLPTIPVRFASVEEYERTFEPLILEECAAQLLQRKEEGQVSVPHEAVVGSVEGRGEGSLVVRLTMPEGVAAGFAENDMLLLDAEKEGGSAPRRRHAMAVVEGHEGEASLRVRLRLDEAAQAGNAAGLQRVRNMRAGLVSGSAWWALRLANLSTVLREWAAVHCVTHMSFKDVLLSGKWSTSLVREGGLEAPPAMRAAMGVAYNESQMAAVTAGLGGAPVVLIQGPPGTGKTRTILGLLSILLHSGPKGAFAPAPGAAAPGGAATDAGGGPWRPRGLTPEERRAAWLAGAPWLVGRDDTRGAVVPVEQADPNAAFGLLRTGVARSVGGSDAPRARILVCAPSNSALDEIVLRLITTGLTDAAGRPFVPSVVRVGVSIHHSVASVALDALVNQRLGTSGLGKGDAAAGGSATPRIGRFERDRLRAEVLEAAAITCTTLSFSGSQAFTRLARKFDVVVVDEAAQAVEPATLVPLAHGGAKQIYLVGDPVQLPATVLSTRATAAGYDGSLFARLQAAGHPVQVLDTQYRMHPRISAFPAEHFYGGSLRNGPDVKVHTQRPWHTCPAFAPTVFYDVDGQEFVPEGSSSLANHAEAEVVLSIYRELVHRHPAVKGTPAVAVISPYKAQVSLLTEKFKKALGPELSRLVDINTIDGFQGRERDVTIFSAVRSSRRARGRHGRAAAPIGIGFVADERRLNVGLTRARASLLIVGSSATLGCDARWAALVRAMRRQNCMYRIRKPYADWVGRVAAGTAPPEEPSPEDFEEPPPEGEFIPEAEPDADDADMYSDAE